jgi:hypothetical protein
MVTTPKKHHYVPAAYLRNFSIANDPERIHVHDKSTNRSFISRVRDAACETNYNTVEIDGQRTNLESLFDKIDSYAPPLIRKILAEERIDNLEREERYGIIAITAVQILRVKMIRTSMVDLMKQLGKSMEDMGIDPKTIENFNIPDEDQAKLFSLQDLATTSSLAKEFVDKICVLHKTSGDLFLVSDNPVVTFNSFPYGQTAIGAQGVEIYLPLSKNYLLGFYCPTIRWKLPQALGKLLMINGSHWDQGLLEGMLSGRAVDSSAHVGFFNSLQVAQSHRFVFSAASDFSLVQSMVSKYPELSRRGHAASQSIRYSE